MQLNTTCQHCGYDVTGLPVEGSCPECGNAYDMRRPMIHSPKGPSSVSYAKPITLGVIALGIFMIGAPLAMVSDHKLGYTVLSLIIAAVPGFGAFAYWWSDRQEAKGRQ